MRDREDAGSGQSLATWKIGRVRRLRRLFVRMHWTAFAFFASKRPRRSGQHAMIGQVKPGADRNGCGACAQDWTPESQTHAVDHLAQKLGTLKLFMRVFVR